MTINDTINEPHRVKELSDWHTERASFWARAADATLRKATAVARVNHRNFHLVAILKLNKK